MKKHPVASIIILSLLIVFAGSSVAYYNTKSFGFDEDAVIFKQEKDGFTFFDYKIYYDDVEYIYNETKEYMPNNTYTLGPHIVDNLSSLLI